MLFNFSVISRPNEGLILFFRIMSALALAALLQGCSAIKLVYGSAPDLSYFWLDGQLDLNDAQTALVRTDLAQFLAWHRANELPKYADVFKRLQPVVTHNVTAEQTCALGDEARLRLDASQRQIEPAAIVLAQSLSLAQLRHLEEKFAKGNTEFREKWDPSSPSNSLRVQMAV